MAAIAVACSQSTPQLNEQAETRPNSASDAPVVASPATPPVADTSRVLSPVPSEGPGGVDVMKVAGPPTPAPPPSVGPVLPGVSDSEPTPVEPRSGSVVAGVVVNDEPPDRDLFALALRLGDIGGGAALSRTVNPQGVEYSVGHQQSFFVTDLSTNETYEIQATLRFVGGHAYWYVDDQADVLERDLVRASEAFENDIRPILTNAFGDIWTPGMDNDPRLTILNTPLSGGVLGYFGSQDEYPRATHPHSNEREMIYMNVGSLKMGDPTFLSVLAHEFQHAVHWNTDPGEDAWINEGLSEIASELTGNTSYFVNVFLRNQGKQLNFWPDEPGASGPHYGGATLFLTYLAQHYGGYDGLRRLAEIELDGINGVAEYLSSYGVTFEDAFKDWVIANYLDTAEGPYSYPDRAVKVRDLDLLLTYGEKQGILPQFSARYIDLRLESGDALVRFEGNTHVQQVGTSCRSGRSCWWGNIGDSIDSTLTRAFDLTSVDEATLEFWTWYDIEKDWDYAYVEVSRDGGETWDILEGGNTTLDNPVGNSYGAGWTGRSGKWTRESIDISDYAGGRILVRFEYITDDAVNLDGIVIDDIAVPEIEYFDDVEGPSDWLADGFKRIDGELPQGFVVQVIEMSLDGSSTVRELTLDEERRGELLVTGFGTRLENAVVVVTPLTRHTYQPASFKLTVSPGR